MALYKAASLLLKKQLLKSMAKACWVRLTQANTRQGADMATEQELAQALAPAFGMYPKAFRGNYGNPQDAANLPVDVLRGRTTGLLGMFGDVVNQPSAFTPVRAVQLAMQGVMGQEKYPDTERFLQTLPLAPTSRAGQVAGQAASFVPLNPAPAVRAGIAGAKALAPTAANMAEQYMVKTGGILPLDVYHGTPHTLPPTERNPLGEFDASKIGTGEGAQAYGHGIYTAEAPAVAKGYQDRLGTNLITVDGKPMDYSNPAHIAASIISDLNNAGLPGKQLASAIRYDPRGIVPFGAKSEVEEIAKALESGNLPKFSNQKGNLYKADLPDEMIPKMLDYDKHLSDQSPEVQKILSAYQREIGGSFGTGEQTLKAIAFERRMKGLDDSPAAVAEQLRQMGIPGIKYLDEGSRIKGEGTRNFVTFPGEEKNLRILERN
jgi:hypothetical protein